jgi:hypothetical protein
MKTKCVLLGLVLCMLLLPAARAEEGWMQETLLYQGHEIEVNGFVQEWFPWPLQQVKIAGAPLEKQLLLSALEQHFRLAPGFHVQDSVDDYYYPSGASGYKDNWYFICQWLMDIDHSFRLDVPEIREAYDACMAFLSSVGIQGVYGAGYACYFSGFDIVAPEDLAAHETTRLRFLIPYDIAGLSTEYDMMIVNRSYVQPSDNTSRHIMDYPFAMFVFDETGALFVANLSSYRVSSAQPLEGRAISWTQAVAAALDSHIIGHDFVLPGGENQPAHDPQFFDKYHIRVVRVLPMWMPNWFNVCLPGWCVQVQLYDQATGAFIRPFSIAIDARTGENLSGY